MIPELGQIALIIALGLALLQAIFPIAAFITKQERYWRIACPLSLGVTFFITLGFLALLFSFAQDDFSVKYVVEHSNSTLPCFYKLSALWSGHEGSLLLWIWLLSCWMLCVNMRSNRLPLPFLASILSCLAWVTVGFLLFLLATSNPFLREYPGIPLDGVDLNPLLQDPGLIFHPPLLYMGYVGSSVVAAFAVAALWQKQIPAAFANWVRPWLLGYFAFLSIGIAWGSYWAYYELGWGGWWFWDPVENASFIPWLISVALIHSLIVVRKRQQLQSWTFLLMILSFGFSLFGTFLVRSGVLTSVHSFANDPKRGVFILLLLSLLVGTALIMYAYRGKALFPKNNLMAVFSREALLLLNSILIVVTAASILLGTLFPMLYEFMFSKTISVGFPYFNCIFIPLMVPVLFSIPLGPFVKWGDNVLKELLNKIGLTFWLCIVLTLFVFLLLHWKMSAIGSAWVAIAQTPLFGKNILLALLGFFLAFWVGLGTLQRLWVKIKTEGIRGVSVNAWGMILAHFGIALIVLGITVVSHFQIEKDVRLSPKDVISLNDYHIRLEAIEKIEGENYVGHRGILTIEKPNQKIAKLYPEKRNYVVQNTTLSETAIDANMWRDIYIALGEPIAVPVNSQQTSQDKMSGSTSASTAKAAWTLRIYYKPGVRWIWVGAIFITFACLLLVIFRKK